MEKIQFMPEGEDRPVSFFVLEETRLAGKQYLLVTDSEEGGGEALILRAEACPPTRAEKEKEEEKGEERPAGTGSAGEGGTQELVSYEVVEDENELSAVLLLMRDALEDLGIEIEE